MAMNGIKLGFVPFYTDNDVMSIGEFFIDDKPLCEWFADTRHLGNCDTNLTGDLKFIQDSIKQLTGEMMPHNAFNTKRFVLYRCHCGCDDCGVISCEIIIQEHTVIWQNVGYENDEIDNSELDEFDQWRLMRFDFKFNKQNYLTELKRFLDSFSC